MGCYVYLLNEVSAGTKAEEVTTPALTFLSRFSHVESPITSVVERALTYPLICLVFVSWWHGQIFTDLLV